MSCVRLVPALLLALAVPVHAEPSLDTRIHRIERDFPTITLDDGQALSFTLQQLMALYRVPGLSVAVADKNEIVWARGWGVTAPGGKIAVGPRTLFQAGSVSKPVAAAAALALVDRGRLSLDEEVNKKLPWC